MREHEPGRQIIEDELDDLFRLECEDAGELWLVRHAEPVRDLSAADPFLSCTGLEQAELLAARLESLWVEAVYSAPERRALQTANVIAAGERPQIVLEGLGDIEFDCSRAGGIPSGSYADRFSADPRWDSLPGFGSSRAFRRRTIQAIESALARHPARRVVVVTHASAINAYLSMLLCIPRDQFFSPDYTGVSIVRWRADSYAVRTLNDTSHLSYGGPLAAGSQLLPVVDCR